MHKALLSARPFRQPKVIGEIFRSRNLENVQKGSVKNGAKLRAVWDVFGEDVF